MLATDTGLTTIEKVRKDYAQSYEGCHTMTKIQLKAWLYHSESRHKNGNQPFSFDNYTNHMNVKLYIEQVKLNMIDCEDIGGKDSTIAFLERWL